SDAVVRPRLTLSPRRHSDEVARYKRGMSDGKIDVRLTFASPEQAIPVADAPADEGWDIRLHVVLDGSASGSDEELQRLHDGLKTIAGRFGIGDKLGDA